MKYPPLPFQEEAIEAINNFDGCALVAMSMGLGKTPTTLWWGNGAYNAFPMLVVCPAGLKGNWESEIQKFLSRGAAILNGESPPHKLHVSTDITIINYDVLQYWWQTLAKCGFKTIVFDEAHRVKNRAAKVSKAARKLSRGIPHRLCLTGTPITNRHAELWQLLNIIDPKRWPSFWSYASTYCLPADAPVLMSDFTEKSISEVKPGDFVIGWGRPGGRRRRLVKSKVKAVLVRESQLQKAMLSNGEVVTCTPDHQWATGWSHAEYQFSILRAGDRATRGRWGASRVMPIMRGTSPIFDKTDAYMKGYIAGFFRGDGHCNKRLTIKIEPFRKKRSWIDEDYSIGAACNDEEPIQRLSDYLFHFSIDHTKGIRSDGMHAITRLARRDVYDFLISIEKYKSRIWWAGFLGGIYDAEGSGRTISQYKHVNLITYNMIRYALELFKFDVTSGPLGHSFRGGRSELVRFWNLTDPTLRRKLVSFLMSAGGRLNAGGVAATTTNHAPFVKSIKPLKGMHKVYTLTTETGNYVAYGLGSKNCSPKKRPWGWDYSGSTNGHLLHKELQKSCMIRIRKEDVLTDLPPKQRNVVRLSLTPQGMKDYNKAFGSFLNWLHTHEGHGKAKKAIKAKQLAKTNYMRKLAAKLKMKSVLEWVDNFLESSDGKICIFAYHKSILGQLEERYQKVSVRIDGNTKKEARKGIVDDFNTSKKLRIFLGQIHAAGIGLNITGAHTVAFVEMVWTPSDHTQAEDRAYGRLSDLHSADCFYLVADGTIEVNIVKLLNRKQKIADAAIDGISGQAEESVFNELLIQLEEQAKGY